MSLSESTDTIAVQPTEQPPGDPAPKTTPKKKKKIVDLEASQSADSQEQVMPPPKETKSTKRTRTVELEEEEEPKPSGTVAQIKTETKESEKEPQEAPKRTKREKKKLDLEAMEEEASTPAVKQEPEKKVKKEKAKESEVKSGKKGKGKSEDKNTRKPKHRKVEKPIKAGQEEKRKKKFVNLYNAILRAQKNNSLEIPSAPFKRLTREMALEHCYGAYSETGIRFQASAFKALQVGTEQFFHSLFKTVVRLLHYKKRQVMDLSVFSTALAIKDELGIYREIVKRMEDKHKGLLEVRNINRKARKLIERNQVGASKRKSHAPKKSGEEEKSKEMSFSKKGKKEVALE